MRNPQRARPSQVRSLQTTYSTLSVLVRSELERLPRSQARTFDIRQTTYAFAERISHMGVAAGRGLTFSKAGTTRGVVRCYTDTLPGRSDKLRAAVRKIQALDFDAKSDKSYNGNDLPFTGQTQEQRVKFRDMVVRLGMVDPAFAYAMGIIRFPL